MDGLANTPTEKLSFTRTLKSWVDDYAQNKEMGVENFLVSRLGQTLTGVSPAAIQEMTHTISSEISSYEQGKEEIQSAVDAGSSKEEWLSKLLQEETAELGAQNQTKILGTLHNGLMDAMGIPNAEESTEEENAPLQSSMIAKSVSDLATGRVMQALGDESELDVEEDETERSEFVEEALKSNSDTELKTLASGAMVVLHKMGKLPMIPQTAPIQAVVNIACFAVDHARTVAQIARKEISLTEGLSRIARDSFAAMRGILRGRHGKFTSEGIIEALPILKKPMALVNSISKGITNLIGDEKVQEKIAAVRERIIPVAQNFAQEFVRTTVSVVQSVATGIKNFLFG